MEIHKLPDKESKITVLKFRELQEDTDWQFNEIKKMMQEQNEKFNRENIKKTKHILELRNIMTEI